MKGNPNPQGVLVKKTFKKWVPRRKNIKGGHRFEYRHGIISSSHLNN